MFGQDLDVPSKVILGHGVLLVPLTLAGLPASVKGTRALNNKYGLVPTGPYLNCNIFISAWRPFGDQWSSCGDVRPLEGEHSTSCSTVPFWYAGRFACNFAGKYLLPVFLCIFAWLRACLLARLLAWLLACLVAC